MEIPAFQPVGQSRSQFGDLPQRGMTQTDIVAICERYGTRVRQYRARGDFFCEYSDEDQTMYKFTGTQLEDFCDFSNKSDGFLCAKLGKSGDVFLIVQLLVLLRHKSKIAHLHFLKATVNAEAEVNMPFFHRELNSDTDYHQATQFCLNVVTHAPTSIAKRIPPGMIDRVKARLDDPEPIESVSVFSFYSIY